MGVAGHGGACANKPETAATNAMRSGIRISNSLSAFCAAPRCCDTLASLHMKTRKLPLALLLFAALPRLSADLASIPATTYEMLDAATGMQVQVSIAPF